MLTATLRLTCLFSIFLPCFVVALLADGTAIGRKAERVVHFVVNGN